MALLRELNAAEDALALILTARENRAERPPVEAQVIEDSVLLYLVQRNLAVLLQIAPNRNARRTVLKHASELGFTRNELRAVM